MTVSATAITFELRSHLYVAEPTLRVWHLVAALRSPYNSNHFSFTVSRKVFWSLCLQNRLDIHSLTDLVPTLTEHVSLIAIGRLVMMGWDWRLRTAACTGLLFISGWLRCGPWYDGIYRLGLTHNLPTRALWQPPVLSGVPVSKDISWKSRRIDEEN
jgi:hypothetical protein